MFVVLLASVLNASFSMQFSEAGKQLLSQHPMYQAFDSLFGANSSARRASALVNTGIATYDTFKTVSDTLARSGGSFTSGAAIELAAKFFKFGTFGVSHSIMHQISTLDYGIPSIDLVSGDLYYNAVEEAEFVGHQARAQNITVVAGQKIVVLPDTEKSTDSVSHRFASAEYNDASLGFNGMNSETTSEIHRPSTFESVVANTFQAPSISMTNPLLKAQLNRFIGETEFITLYDVSRGHGSSYGLGLSFLGSNGFAPRGNINGGRNHFYTETAPLFGVEGDLNITGSLRNDSVPVAGNIVGNYSFSYHAPVSERGGYSVNLSGLDLSDSRAFANTFTNAVKSGLLGYAAGRVAQEAGLGDFVSSLIGSIASAYAGDSNEGLTSVGHISEIRNGHKLDIELVGFNREQFNAEIAQIKQTIFDEATAEGASEEEASERVEIVEDWAVDTVNKAKAEGKSDEEAIEEVRENSEVTKEIVKIDQKVKKEDSEINLANVNANTGINQGTVELLLSKLTQEIMPVTPQEKAMRTYLMLRLLESSANPTRENLSKLERTVNFAKKNFGRFLNGLYEWITPQTAEAIPVVAGPAIDIALVKVAIWLSENPQVVQNAVSTASGLWQLGQVFERSKPKKSSSSSTNVHGNMNPGGGSSMPPDPEQDPGKPRIESTSQDADRYLNGLKQHDVLSRKGITRDGHEYYRFERKCEYNGVKFKKGDYISRDELHHEWEWFRGKDTHKGPINSVTGKVDISKAKSDRVLKLP